MRCEVIAEGNGDFQEQRPQGQKMAQVAAAGLAALFIAAVPAQAADTESLKKKM